MHYSTLHWSHSGPYLDTSYCDGLLPKLALQPYCGQSMFVLIYCYNGLEVVIEKPGQGNLHNHKILCSQACSLARTRGLQYTFEEFDHEWQAVWRTRLIMRYLTTNINYTCRMPTYVLYQVYINTCCQPGMLLGQTPEEQV